MIYNFCMTYDNKKFTTIRISRESFDKLFIMKRAFELQDKKEYNYNDVIVRLLEIYEGLKL